MKGKIVDDRIVWPSNNDNVRCVLKLLFSMHMLFYCGVKFCGQQTNLYLELSYLAVTNRVETSSIL